LRDRLAAAQEKTCRRLDASGFEVFCEPRSGMFVWARPAGIETDSSRLAERALEQKILLAPGHLFFAGRISTGWLRFNVAHCNFDRLFAFLADSAGR
jgi:DNA-binding transcriptional MocR family regulator